MSDVIWLQSTLKRLKVLSRLEGGAYPRVEGADSFLSESLLEKSDTGFIEDMKSRHNDAHRGDWQTYLRMTVADWKMHPNLTDDEWAAIKCPAFFYKW